MPVYTSADLIDAARVRDFTDRIAGIYRRFVESFGWGTEPYHGTVATTFDTDDLSVVMDPPPAAAGASWAAIYPNGGVLRVQSACGVEIAGGQVGQKLYVGGVEFEGVAANPTGNQFVVNNLDDAVTAQNLAAAINATASAPASAFAAYYTPGQTAFYLSARDPFDLRRVQVWSTADINISPRPRFCGGVEEISCASVTGNTWNVTSAAFRGWNGSIPAHHIDSCGVYVPSSVSRYAKRILEEVVGDGASLAGVGANGAEIIKSLVSDYDSQADSLIASAVVSSLLSVHLRALDGHIGKIAPSVLVTEPSYGAVIVSRIADFLRYMNDAAAGTPFSCLASDRFSQVYFQYTGGDVLADKTTFPLSTELARVTFNGAGVMTVTYGEGLRRYGAADPAGQTRRQGYVGQRIRARVTQAGTGSISALSLACQGQDENGRYFGRPDAVSIVLGTDGATANPPQANDTLTINGYTFTFKASASLPSEVTIGATNTATAANLAAKVNESTDPLLDGLVSALAAANAVEISPTDPDDQANRRVSCPAAQSPRVTLSAGTATGLAVATFGGGAGASPNAPGDGADSGQAGAVAAHDDPRTFSSSLILGFAILNNTIPLPPADGTSRALQVVTAAVTGSGSNATVVIETTPDRDGQ